MTIQMRDAVEERFLTDVCEQYPVQSHDWQAKALFHCISAAFTKNSKEKWGESVLAHPDLIRNLAACAMSALDHDPSKVLPWERWSPVDYALPRTLRFFMSTICEAIQEGRVHEVDGKLLHGCYNVPRWYYEKCMEEARQGV